MKSASPVPRNSDLVLRIAGRDWHYKSSRFRLIPLESTMRDSRVANQSIQIDERSAAQDAEPAPAFVERRTSNPDRRRTSLWSLIKGGLIPQRRAGRRASDHDSPIDWHDPYLLFLAVLMLSLSVTDAFFTVKLITNGAEEANPVLAFMLNEYPGLFAIAKMLLTGFGILVMVALARARLFGLISGRLIFQIMVLAYVVLVGYELWLLRWLR